MQEIIELRRDCPVVLVPSGRRALLPQGEQVAVVQRLGGNFTVRLGHGALARIEGADADALGAEALGADAHRDGVDGDGVLDAGAPGAGQPAASPSTGEQRTGAGAQPDARQVLDRLRTVFDPEIPVNVVDLGLIYDCAVHRSPHGGSRVEIAMSMTAPGCGMGDILRAEAEARALEVPGVTEAAVELVFTPPWDMSRMSEAARLELGMW